MPYSKVSIKFIFTNITHNIEYTALYNLIFNAISVHLQLISYFRQQFKGENNANQHAVEVGTIQIEAFHITVGNYVCLSWLLLNQRSLAWMINRFLSHLLKKSNAKDNSITSL